MIPNINPAGESNRQCLSLLSLLVIVLAHTQCGAVTATVQGGASEVTGNLKSVVDAIKPAIAIAGSGSIPAVTEANARIVVEGMMKRSAVIEKACTTGLKVLPAMYYLDSGEVEFLQ